VRVLGVLSPLDFSPGSISLGKVWLDICFCNDDGKSKSFQEVGRASGETNSDENDYVG
jgi:hypothetical protein